MTLLDIDIDENRKVIVATFSLEEPTPTESGKMHKLAGTTRPNSTDPGWDELPMPGLKEALKKAFPGVDYDDEEVLHASFWLGTKTPKKGRGNGSR